MESSTSYIGIGASNFSTEVDYTTTIDPKPKPDEQNNTVYSEGRCFWKNGGIQILEVENEKMEEIIIHLKSAI